MLRPLARVQFLRMRLENNEFQTINITFRSHFGEINAIQNFDTRKKVRSGARMSLVDHPQYSGISLRRTHHRADTLYNADKDIATILYFFGQRHLKVILQRTVL